MTAALDTVDQARHRLAIEALTRRRARAPRSHIALYVDDLNAAHDALKDKGVQGRVRRLLAGPGRHHGRAASAGVPPSTSFRIAVTVSVRLSCSEPRVAKAGRTVRTAIA